jgi:predicted RNA polymerase sigma factor
MPARSRRGAPSSLGRCGPDRRAYLGQAAIAGEHGRARAARQTDWAAIAGLYGRLALIDRSPVVELNRATAVAMAATAAADYRRALALAANPQERAFLERRLRELGAGP